MELHQNVQEVFRVRETHGALGVEIEVEGRHLPHEVRGWRMEHDGSLRGNSMEYVLRKPGSLKQVRGWLNNLDAQYKANGTHVDESVRAGVHVHVNVQDLNMLEVYTTMALYFVLEPLLVEWCGDSRIGNHFCLRTSDAEYLIDAIQQSVWESDIRHLCTDNLRYASMNVHALKKYGSIEFRAMRGTRDLDAIYTWANMLFNMKEAARGFRDPQEVVQIYSDMCVDDFLVRVLGPLAGELQDLPEYKRKVLEGVRVAQEIAYCSEWRLDEKAAKVYAADISIANKAERMRGLRGDEIIMDEEVAVEPGGIDFKDMNEVLIDAAHEPPPRKKKKKRINKVPLNAAEIRDAVEKQANMRAELPRHRR